jgi:hypothetical protein
MTSHSPIQKQLVCDWNDKWHELSQLVLGELFSTEEVDWSLQPRTDIDELHYLRLRFWFVDHEAGFLSIWRGCVSCGSLESYQTQYPGLTPEDITTIKNLDNPFSRYYEPDNLYQFANYLGAQIGVLRWSLLLRQGRGENKVESCPS